MKKPRESPIYTARAVEFLNSIGIKTEVVEEAGGLAPGVNIVDGGLKVESNCQVFLLLHEAGHLAVTPPRYRRLMNGNLKPVMSLIRRDAATLPRDSSERASCMAATVDSAANAWAFAVGAFLSIPKGLVIRNSFKTGALDVLEDGKTVRRKIEELRYEGVRLLAHAGFCASDHWTRKPNGMPVYPKLKRWIA